MGGVRRGSTENTQENVKCDAQQHMGAACFVKARTHSEPGAHGSHEFPGCLNYITNTTSPVIRTVTS